MAKFMHLNADTLAFLEKNKMTAALTTLELMGGKHRVIAQGESNVYVDVLPFTLDLGEPKTNKAADEAFRKAFVDYANGFDKYEYADIIRKNCDTLRDAIETAEMQEKNINEIKDGFIIQAQKAA